MKSESMPARAARGRPSIALPLAEPVLETASLGQVASFAALAGGGAVCWSIACAEVTRVVIRLLNVELASQIFAAAM